MKMKSNPTLFFRIIVKREKWCLTWRGYLLVGGLCVVLALTGILGCGPFLSVNQPVDADVLIVEGWLSDYALQGAAEEFSQGHYRYLVTAGGPLKVGYHLSHLKTYAELARSTLVQLGVDPKSVVSVSGPEVLRDRTLSHAVAVQEWIQVNDPDLRSVNIYTMGAHSRRSWLVFAKVLGDNVNVGVIAHSNRDYDLDRWWTTSEGFRSVTSEAMAYVWMRLRKLA